MIIGCLELDRFFDGELGAEQAAEFRDHVSGCGRCQRVLHGRMQEAMIVDVDVRAPDMLAVRRARLRAGWLAVLVPVLGAAAVGVVTLSRGQPAPHAPPLQVAMSIDHAGPAMRGTSAHLGDVLRVTARGARHRAIWIYKNERELVARCPELGPAAPVPVPVCQVTADALQLQLAFASRGTYAVVTLGAASALPMPSGSLDGTLDAASTIDGSYQIGHVEVD